MVFARDREFSKAVQMRMNSNNLVEFCIAQVHQTMPEDTPVSDQLDHAMLMLTALVSQATTVSDKTARLAIEKMHERRMVAVYNSLTKEQLKQVLDETVADGDMPGRVKRFLGAPIDANTLREHMDSTLRKAGPHLKPDDGAAE